MGKHHGLCLEGWPGFVGQWFIICGLCILGWGLGWEVSSALAACSTVVPEPRLCPVPSPVAFAVPCWVMCWLAAFGGFLHGVCSL